MGKYSVIYVDCPWWYPNRDPKKKFGYGAGGHYELMKYPQLKDMAPLFDSWAADNCVLFTWATGPRANQAIQLITDWGFRYSTLAFVWIKTNKDGGYFSGPGNYTGSNAELVYMGVRGSMPPKAKLVNQVVDEPEVFESEAIITGRTQHSVKPEEVRRKIQLMYDGPYLEIFARRPAEGWDVTGLETTGERF